MRQNIRYRDIAATDIERFTNEVFCGSLGWTIVEIFTDTFLKVRNKVFISIRCDDGQLIDFLYLAAESVVVLTFAVLIYAKAKTTTNFLALLCRRAATMLQGTNLEHVRVEYKNEKCQTPHVTEEEVKELFIKAYNELLSEKKEIIENAEIIRKTLCKTESMIEEKQRLEDEILVLVEMTQNLVAENARVAQDQNEYQKRYDGLVQRYETAKKSYDDLVAKIEQKEAHGERIKQFIKNLKEQQCVLAEFDDALWGSMVEYVTIGKENRSVTFKDGTEITVE